jgi:hypothetical protein
MEVCVNTRYFILALTIPACVGWPSVAAAQQSSAPSVVIQQTNIPPAGTQQVTVDVEPARNWGLGLQAGAALDPILIDVGGHARVGPIFSDRVTFRPGIDFGFGEVTTTFGINLDVLFRLTSSTSEARWAPYVGVGPNFAMSHVGFNPDDQEGGDVDVADDDDVDDDDDPSRFDFSDTDFETGLNLIVGARSRRGMFFEFNATAYGVTNIRLLVGFDF